MTLADIDTFTLSTAQQYVGFLAGRADEMKRPGLVTLCNDTLDTLAGIANP